MKKVLLSIALVVAGAAVLAFLAFLYLVPPFFIIPPEQFTTDLTAAPPGVDDIPDLAERAIAERGLYLVRTAGCNGCHATNGPRGPDLTKYLAGGGLKTESKRGTFVSRNLTPDRQTGLGGRSDDEVKRVLRSGVLPDGRVSSHTVMPWANFSNWTDEDRHAVVVYLRHVKPIAHAIPNPGPPAALPAGAVQQAFGAKDYGTGAARSR